MSPLSMNTKTHITNARIIDPASNADIHGELLSENGVIVEIAEGNIKADISGATTIDAKGQILCPGLIDMRVFVGEPGHEYRETLKSAGDAAVAGGVTTCICMPDTSPALDDHALVEFITRRAQAESKVRMLPAAAMTKGLAGTELTEFGLLQQAGAIALTDGKKSIQSSALFRSICAYASNFDLLVMHHTVDYDLRGEGVMNEGLFATTLGLKGIPAAAESIALSRDLQIAALTGVRYHATQISCAKSASEVARAKTDGSRVTAGISINNLTLNELDIGSYRSFFKLSPPLRSEDERQSMIAALKDGTIDIIHSSHDPQDVEVKRRPFADAANGAIGLETLLAASLRLVHDGSVPLMTVLKAMTSTPADILGLPQGKLTVGAPADFILVDLDYPWVNDETQIRSRSKNTAFEGARFTGKVMHSFIGGECVYSHSD